MTIKHRKIINFAEQTAKDAKFNTVEELINQNLLDPDAAVKNGIIGSYEEEGEEDQFPGYIRVNYPES